MMKLVGHPNPLSPFALPGTPPAIEPPDDLVHSRVYRGDNGVAPAAPVDLGDTGIAPGILGDLALRTAYLVPQFSTEWASRQLHLPQPIVGEILEQMRTDHLLDVL